MQICVLMVFVWGGEELKEEEIHLGKQKQNMCAYP